MSLQEQLDRANQRFVFTLWVAGVLFVLLLSTITIGCQP